MEKYIPAVSFSKGKRKACNRRKAQNWRKDLPILCLIFYLQMYRLKRYHMDLTFASMAVVAQSE